MSKLVCQCCGKEINWPPLDYTGDAPWRQFGVKEEEFDARVALSRDDCIIDDEHFLLRGNVNIPITGTADTFAWGVWCSVSKANYERIANAWERSDRESEPPAFAWLLTSLPCYAAVTAPVKARLHFRPPNVAFAIEVDPEHPLGREQIDGITMDRVKEFARETLGPDAAPSCAACRP